MGRTQSLTFSGRLAVVLVSTRNPLNIGAAARAMSNFGFSQLRLVDPYSPAFREAKSAVGASDLLAEAREYPSVAEAVADCAVVIGTTAGRNRQLRHEMVLLPNAVPRIRSEIASGVALLFGSEKRGLSNEDLSHCDWVLQIPTAAKNPSMNLGQAVAVCLYEMARDAKASGKIAARARASSADLNRLTATLLEALENSEYLTTSNTRSEERIRLFVRGLGLSPKDSQTLTGMVRHMLWKMRQSS
jgi:TrmH family RNA methyltransferase